MKDYRAIVDDPEVSSQNREIARRQLATTLFDRDAKRIADFVKARDYAAARAVLQHAADTPESEPSRPDYERLGRRVDEDEAWSAIVTLADQGRDAELRIAALAFAEKFPQSRAAAEARRLSKLPLRAQPPTATKTVSPNSD